MSTTSARNRPRAAGPGRVVLLVVAVIVAAMVAVVWILPGMLDWNRYRGSVAALVSAGIGRPVELNGNITLHLLPQPILTASGLRLSDSGDGVAMEAHEVRLRVALGPLLGGRVDARELVLRGADLRLPWPPPPGALSRRPPAWLTGLQARVEQSRLQVGEFVVDDVDASLASDPDSGTLSVAGAAKILGQAWHFTARLGKPARDGTAPLDVSLDGQAKLRDTGGTFSGALGQDGALTGRVVARGPDLSQVMPAPPLAWRGDGRLSASGGLAVADELALELGGSPARGAVALRVQPDMRLDLAVTAGRIDLDAWMPVLLRTAQSAKPGFPSGIDLSAEAANLAGGTIRHLRCAFDIDQNGMSVRDGTALLPGDAKLTLQGRFPRPSRGTIFEGVTELAAPDLRATLHWLEPFAPALLGSLPPGALRASELTAKVALDPAQLSFTDLKGTLDGAAAQGGLALRLGARPGISAGLVLDHLLLDPFLPDPAVLSDPADAYAKLNRALSATAFDADVKLQVRKASWRGGDFGPLSVDAQTEGTRLTLRRLEVSALGVHGTASGTMADGGRISEGRIELTTQNVAELRSLLPPDRLPTQAILRGPASLLLQLSGPAEAMAVKAAMEVGDLRLEAQPTINVPAQRWAGSVTAHHPGAPRMLEQLGIPATAPWLGDGSFSIVAQVAAAPGKLDLANFELIAGALRASGQLSQADGKLTGKIQAETLTLPLPYPRSPDPLPVDALRGWAGQLHLGAAQVFVGLTPTVQDFAGDVTLGATAVTLENATAKLAGGAVSGGAKIEWGEKPLMSVDAQVSDVALGGPLFGGSIDVTSGVLQGSVTLHGEGYSPAALAATLTGRGEAIVRDAEIAGFDLAAVQAALADPAPGRITTRLRGALAAGATRVPELRVPFDIRRGVVNLHASGGSPPASAIMEGTLDLLGGVLEGVLTLRPGPDLPDVAERLTGPANAPVRTPEFAAVARWLAERP